MRINALWIVLALSIVGCGGVTGPGPEDAQPPPTDRRATPTQSPVLNRQTPTQTIFPSLTPSVTLTPTHTPTTPPTPNAIGEDNLSGIVPLHLLEGHTGGVTSLAFSPDGALLASAAEDGIVSLWQVRDGALLFPLEGHLDVVRSVAFSPDGSLLASGSDDRSVRFWGTQDGSLMRTISTDILGRAIELEFSPDGSLIAIGGHFCFIMLRNTNTGILRRTLRQPQCMAKAGGSVEHWGLAFTPDGASMITGEGRPGSSGGSIQLWDFEAYGPPELVKGYDLVVRDLSLSPDGETLAVAFIGSSQFWGLRLSDGELLNIFEGHELRVNAVRYSPDGRLLVSGGRDMTIRLWDPETGELLHTLEGHSDAVNSVVFSPDGALIASASDDGTVLVWSLPPP